MPLRTPALAAGGVGLVLGLLSCLAPPAPAAVLVVRQDGRGDFERLPAALEAAAAGDTVDIGPGLWMLNATLEKPLSLRAQEGPGSAVLDGGRKGRILRLEVPAGGEGSTTYLVEGLVLRHGVGATSSSDGGAVYCRGEGRFVFVDCEFVANSAHDGGALHSRLGATVRAEGCRFRQNRAARVGGAATAILGADAQFLRCEFVDNEAGVFAGAIATDQVSLDVEECIFRGNEARKGTGVVNLNASDARIRSCTFVGNRSGSRATVVAEINSALELESCILAWDAGAHAVLATSSSELVRRCNLYWENALGASPDGLEATGTEADPGFCDLASGHLAPVAGSPASVFTPGCSGPRGALGAGCQGGGRP